MSGYQIARFRVDITPPVGQPLCGGWYGNSVAIADPLYALGLVLLGGPKPIVLCAIDWSLLSNDSHLQWCEAIASAVNTSVDHVTAHCTHAHCTPWPDRKAQELVSAYPDIPQVCDMAWCDDVVLRVAAGVKASLASLEPVTHVGLGQACVDQVAANRRIIGSDGQSRAVRYTKTIDPAVRDEPQGLIDPMLRTVSFWNENHKLAALHYYTVHPTSQDRDHIVTAEFVGRARQMRQDKEPDSLHVYFTGCAGNVTAGKYNDGSPPMRQILADRVHSAMLVSEQDSCKYPLTDLQWHVEPVILPVRPDRQDADEHRRILADPTVRGANRNRRAFALAYQARIDRPILITCLTLADKIKLLHLPAESFVEYQLQAQLQACHHTVATAAYGDCGPLYICLSRSYDEGGYEPIDSEVGPSAQAIMEKAIRACVAPA